MAHKAHLRATVDRIERDAEGRAWATLLFDDGQQLTVAEELLPPSVRPQQVLSLEFRIDSEETSRRAAEVRRLQQELFGQ